LSEPPGVVPAVLGPALLEVAQARLHRLLGEGYLHHEPADRHHTAFDEALGEALHRHLAPLVAAVVGRALVPSYCYLTHYLQGAVLPPHTDNAQCQVSLAVTLLATPGPEAAQDWPLCLHPEGRPARRIVLLPGDGLIFYGRDLVHGREGALATGRTLTSLVLHFVDPVTYRGPLKRSDHV